MIGPKKSADPFEYILPVYVHMGCMMMIGKTLFLLTFMPLHFGRKTLGNYPASGTAIIQELGEEHVRTGYPIVYTSADSVFQIAAHEEVIKLEELYRMSENTVPSSLSP